jgi:hypothetical protein
MERSKQTNKQTNEDERWQELHNTDQDCEQIILTILSWCL